MIETILATVGNDAVNILGLAVLAVMLYSITNRLLDTIIERMDKLEDAVSELKIQVAELVQQVNSSAVPRR
jgi:hypothetical protein